MGRKKIYWTLLSIFLIAVLSGFLIYPIVWNKGVDWLNNKVGFTVMPHFLEKPFKLGLDLQGGTHLVYEADLSNIASEDYIDSMQGVRDVVERRVNLFGVSEPVIQVNKVGSHYRLIVELAGVKDAHEVIKMIGETPFLDFREEIEISQEELDKQQSIYEKYLEGIELTEEEKAILAKEPFSPTILTGRYLKGAELQFDQQTYQSQVSLEFDSEGAKIFEDLTRRNIGKRIAIYLDGSVISAPNVQEAISGGKAQITGNFTLDEAKELVQRLNAGALPVPIDLINQQTIGASLGSISLDKSLKAGIFGFLAILLFIIFYYRLPGLIASLALVIYVILVLAIFKLISVTLTLAGIAGFILSIGMAVDANVLIFERFKEEFKSGKSLGGSIDEGFDRAWPAIRDGNISTMITCIILFIFATGLVKGFALTLGIGVLVSMFSAIIITKTFLRWFVGRKLEEWKKIWG
ncbi:protein translocase subunit SecD [Patescibacteria group bacterium]|nr:protein translocase subunit SecD [Patescibacteria group bacterium]